MISPRLFDGILTVSHLIATVLPVALGGLLPNVVFQAPSRVWWRAASHSGRAMQMRRAHSKVLTRRTVAVELASDGITANAVAPDPTETELFRENNPKGGEGRSVIWPECRWGDCFRISPDVITVVQPGNEGGHERSLIQLAGSIIFAAGHVVPSGFTV